MSPESDNLQNALQHFGLSSFRPGQREVIEAIVAGHDCMCVMPTGGGKSLCYQLPSVIRPGLTIVVSPLIALMKDQVDALCRLGIPAALINSTLSAGEQQSRLQDLSAGKYKLVYVAPERLRNHRFLEAIRATPIQLLAVDEAHCISQWGHDFRPDYARIGKFREWLGGAQTVALTATATPRVRQDIVDVLGLQKPKQFMSGFARPNLHFGVVPASNDREKDSELEEFLSEAKGAGIIYAATRKRCEHLVEWISEKLHISVGAYHAGLLPDQRRAVQERFMKNRLRIVVATNAFGMGIDKPDLRFVIHYNMPGSLEAYYQEAGRAGRDGKRSQCVLLYSYQDRYIQEFFIDNNYPPPELMQRTYEFLCRREEDPIELTLEEIRDGIGESVSPEAIGNCLQIISRSGVIERLERGGGLAMLRIDSNLPTLVDLLPKEAKTRRKVLRVMERAIGDRRGEQVYVHPRWLQQETGLDRDALQRHLREVAKLDAVDYVPPFRGRAVHFVKHDVPFDELDIDFEKLRKRKDAEYDRLNQVVNFAQSARCRQASILRYFGDPNPDNCQQCDRCCRSPGWPQVPSESLSSVDSKSDTHRAHTADSRTQSGVDQSARTDSPVQSHANKSDPSSADTTGKESLGERSQRGASNSASEATNQAMVARLEAIVGAIERIHGRLGKLLIAQYLCGSQNAKVQKLNLHRLSSFGLLSGMKQTDGVKIIEAMLAAGILRQQEVNRNRPTISLSPELMDVDQRAELLANVQLPPALQSKLSLTLRNPRSESGPSPASQRNTTETQTHTADDRQAQGTPATAERPQVDPTSATRHDRPPPTENNSADASPTRRPSPEQDWQWSLKLFQAGYSWNDVCQIRRLEDWELASGLCAALRAGESIHRDWLDASDDGLRTTGQQRVLREVRRRAAAGIQ